MTAVDLRDEDVVAQRLRRSEDRSASINNSGRAERDESLQIMIPNERGPTVETELRSPALYTDRLIAGWRLR